VAVQATTRRTLIEVSGRDEYAATGAVRAVRVHGARGSIASQTIASWVDARTGTVWEVESSGHVQGTRLEDFATVEHALARGGEVAVEAHFLPGNPSSIALLLYRESSNIERVVLARLDTGALIELARPRPSGWSVKASLDGAAVFIWHPWVNDGALSRFTATGEADGSVVAPWVDGVEDDAWETLDRDRFWRVDGEGIVAGAFGDPSVSERIVSDGARLQAIVGAAGGSAIVHFTRDAEGRARARALRSDGAVWFERAIAWKSAFFAEDRGQLLFFEERATFVRGAGEDEREERVCPGQYVAITDGCWVLRNRQSIEVRSVEEPTKVERPEPQPIATLALSRSGDRVVTVEGGERLRCYRTSDGAVEHELVLDAIAWQGRWVDALCEGDQAAAIVHRDEWDRSVSLWRMGETEAALSVAFSLDDAAHARLDAVSSDGSRALVSLADDDRGERWVLRSRREGEPRSRDVGAGRLQRARFCADDSQIELLTDERLCVYAIDEGRMVSESAAAVVESTLSQQALGAVVSAACEASDTPAVHLWGVAGRSVWQESSMLRRTVAAIAVAEEAPRVAVALGPSIAIVVLDAHATEVARVERRASTADRVLSLACSADGKTVVAGTLSGQLIVVELE
jgi:hypothetical protein